MGKPAKEPAEKPVEMTDAQREILQRYLRDLGRAQKAHEQAKSALGDVCSLIAGEDWRLRQTEDGPQLFRAPDGES